MNQGRSGLRPALRVLLERVRDSQFLIPAFCILASFGLVAAATGLDEREVVHPVTITSSVVATRTLLATVAGAIITIAALVFSLSAVTMQLAATQYSPRVVQGFLRDRRQQIAFGISIGTFTYALSALAALPDDPAGSGRADWTATTAVVLAVLTAVMIVAFIDHVIRKVRIDDTIRGLTDRTIESFTSRSDEPMVSDAPWDVPDDEEPTVLRSPFTGFVQSIDVTGLAAALPAGVIARLDVWAGYFVTEGRRLLTVWAPDDGDPPSPVSFIAIGEQRTIDQDPGFGIRQMVDIALRALSPGVNDPATAADVVRRITGVVRAAYLASGVNRVYPGTSGARLFAPHAPTVDHFVSAAFTPIRRAAADQPLVLATISDAAMGLIDELDELEIDSAALAREAQLADARREAIENEDQKPLG